jgi:acetyl esterase/lipase
MRLSKKIPSCAVHDKKWHGTFPCRKASDTELKLDLARPQGDGPFPAIVLIHGGGW